MPAPLLSTQTLRHVACRLTDPPPACLLYVHEVTPYCSCFSAPLLPCPPRPSDTWLAGLAAAARQRLGAASTSGDDLALLGYGLAVMGWQLQERAIKVGGRGCEAGVAEVCVGRGQAT